LPPPFVVGSVPAEEEKDEVWVDNRIQWEYGIGEAGLLHESRKQQLRCVIIGGMFPWWFGYARRLGLNVCQVALEDRKHEVLIRGLYPLIKLSCGSQYDEVDLNKIDVVFFEGRWATGDQLPALWKKATSVQLVLSTQGNGRWMAPPAV
jgi:hypothetical protein